MAGLVKYLYRNKHMSPFEHGSFTFMVECPIFVAREFMRHRTFSYNEVSGRYTDMKPVFYIPKRNRPLVQHGKVGEYTFTPGDSDQYAAVRVHTAKAYQSAWDAYMELKQLGVANEVARNVLPVGLFTAFYATCNPRNLMQFLDLRTAPNALAEIRAVASQMEIHLKNNMPITYDAWSNND